MKTTHSLMRRKDSALNDRDVSSGQGKGGQSLGDSLNITVLGVCTGTGLGHLDCALVRFRQSTPSDPLRVKLERFDRVSIPASVGDLIISYLRDGRRKPHPAPDLDELLGRLFSSGIETFCRKHAIDVTSIDLVGTHSEILKRLVARENLDGTREHPLHWNSMVTAETGISTVFDFTIIEHAVNLPRIRPITYFDRVLLQSPDKFRVCLNIDEIANLNFIPPRTIGGARATQARDCGPGSLLIDYAMRYCTSNNQSEDRDGRHGAQGKVNQAIVDQFLNAHDYLRQLPPMSIATEMFGDHEAQRLVDECLYSGMSEADTIATITQATAQNILKQYNRLLQLSFPPGQKVDEIFICGPASRNTNIIEYLEAQLPENVITKPMHDIGILNAAHEAVCYAYLALEAVLGQATQAANSSLRPSSAHPSANAVRARVVSGRGWSELLNHVLEFSGGHPLHSATDVRMTGSLETAMEGMDIR